VRRADRSSDSFLKRQTARWFYKIHTTMAEPKIPQDVGDFQLFDRAVVEALRSLPERRRFMKGLFAWVGFRQIVIDCTRQARIGGSSKFSVWRLWNLALEGITSFSTLPLRWFYVGLITSAIAFVYMTYIVSRTLILGVDVPGYASLLVAILFFGGLQLVGIGIIGEYLGRVYLEAKQRPNYIVRGRYPPEIYRASGPTEKAN
jgi:polyisoprenyl-phosphate glycosyltransferase